MSPSPQQPVAADPAREQRLEDELPLELQQVVRDIPPIPRSFGILRQLLALLPNPLQAGLRPPALEGDQTPQPPPSAMSQLSGYGSTILGNGPGAIPGTDIMPGSVSGGVDITPGSLPASTFDTTPPAVPTGLALTSDLLQVADGEVVVRIIASFTPPPDTDYFATYIEVTRDNNGGQGGTNPSPVWTNPVKLFAGVGLNSVALLGVVGNLTYWARAYSVDVQGNKSAYTSVVSVVTAKDSTALAVPQGFAVVAGFRGVGASWNSVSGADLWKYQLRYRPTGSSSDYTVIDSRTTVVWVPNLTPGTSYDFAVRAIDLSGNVATSDSDPTPVDYSVNPDAGYCTIQAATPNSVGTADIAAGSITAALISAAGLSADVIKSGKITLRPSGASTAIEIYDSNNVLVGTWTPTIGLQIFDPANAANYALFNAAVLSFYQAGVLTAQISPSGILADSIRLGTLSGGHNVVANSSFELAAFVTGTTSVLFTDNVGTPGWKAANRITAPDNITESTTLTAAVAF